MSKFIRGRIYGRGLGGIFRSVYKFFRPLLNFLLPTITKVASSKTGKKLIKQAKKSALKAGIHTIGDISSGENVKSSISKNLKKAKKDILNRLDDDNRVGKKKIKNKKKKGYNFFH